MVKSIMVMVLFIICMPYVPCFVVTLHPDMKTYVDNKVKDGPEMAFMAGEFDHTLAVGSPLLVEGCLIMSCLSGESLLSVNSRTHRLRPGRGALLVFDMVAVPVRVSLDFRCRFLAVGFGMSQDIFFMITSNRFWDSIYQHPVLVMPDDVRDAFGKWFGLVGWTLDNFPPSLADRTLRHATEDFLSVMSHMIERHQGRAGTPPSKSRAWTVANDFLGLLNRHYASHHDVAFYADRLHVSSNYLNIIVQRHMGTSAKEQINIQIMLVVRMLLDTTDMTVTSIAERTGFDDPSYMCRMFRRRTGMSPMQYRNQHRDPRLR